MKELEDEVKEEVNRIFMEAKSKIGVEATLDLNFITDTPIIEKNVYGEAFPFERPPRVWLEVSGLDATTREITEVVCEELLHIRHPELSEEEVRSKVPRCLQVRSNRGKSRKR